MILWTRLCVLAAVLTGCQAPSPPNPLSSARLTTILPTALEQLDPATGEVTVLLAMTPSTALDITFVDPAGAPTDLVLSGAIEARYIFDGMSWSPDGRVLALVMGLKVGAPEIGLVSAADLSDGDLALKVTYYGLGDVPMWSPDGATLIVERCSTLLGQLYEPCEGGGGKNTRLVAVELATGLERDLTGDNVDEHSVRWRPGTSDLLFTSKRRPGGLVAPDPGILRRAISAITSPVELLLEGARLLDVHPNGTTLLVRHLSGTYARYDLTTATSSPLDDAVTPLAWSPDGALLLGSRSDALGLVVLDDATGVEVAEVPCPGHIACLLTSAWR